VKNAVLKRLWTCRRTDNVVMTMMMMMMMMMMMINILIKILKLQLHNTKQRYPQHSVQRPNADDVSS